MALPKVVLICRNIVLFLSLNHTCSPLACVSFLIARAIFMPTRKFTSGWATRRQEPLARPTARQRVATYVGTGQAAQAGLE